MKKQLNFVTSVAEMQTVEAEPVEWIVEGLLRTGRRRISLLTGKPESGKSTLARQLAVAVSQGRPFLGRTTVRGAVLFWQSEEDVLDIRESFRNLGYNPRTDEPILVFTGGPNDNNLDNFDAVLTEHPNVKLALIETLDDLLKIPDLKENSDTSRKFEEFEPIVARHYHRTAIVGLHHLKKRECNDAGEMILGATVLRGKTDAKIYVTRPDSDDERRIVQATVRRGRAIAKTFLEFDPQTETATLGTSYAAYMASQAAQTQGRIEEQIIAFFQLHPDSNFESDCLPVIKGNRAAQRQALKRLLGSGRLVRAGKGTKGDPATYRVAISTPELQVQFGEVIQ